MHGDLRHVRAIIVIGYRISDINIGIELGTVPTIRKKLNGTIPIFDNMKAFVQCQHKKHGDAKGWRAKLVLTKIYRKIRYVDISQISIRFSAPQCNQQRCTVIYSSSLYMRGIPVYPVYPVAMLIPDSIFNCLVLFYRAINK